MDSQIPTLTLPSGGTVEFVDLDDLTGEDLHKLRATMKQADSSGETANKLMREAMRLAIKTWDIPYLVDPRTPEANEGAWKKLRARDLQAIETVLDDTVLPIIRPAKPAADNGEPGSPPRPDSE